MTVYYIKCHVILCSLKMSFVLHQVRLAMANWIWKAYWVQRPLCNVVGIHSASLHFCLLNWFE